MAMIMAMMPPTCSFYGVPCTQARREENRQERLLWENYREERRGQRVQFQLQQDAEVLTDEAAIDAHCAEAFESSNRIPWDQMQRDIGAMNTNRCSQVHVQQIRPFKRKLN